MLIPLETTEVAAAPESTPVAVAASASMLALTPGVTVDLKSMPRAELTTWVTDVLGEPRFRADQIFRWIHMRGARSFEDMTDLNKPMRAHLASIARLGGLELEGVKLARDGTRKLLLKTSQGDRIESVIIPMEDRFTQCVSSQVGCKIGCDFCLTARMPLKRHLAASEIVDQVMWARRILIDGAPNPDDAPRIANIVYMGMGEPLDNYDNVMKSLRILTDDHGINISPRRITVSTSGVVPKLQRLAKEDVQPQLAISLNASHNEQRSGLIPINKVWPIEELVRTLKSFPLAARRRITIEYVLLAGVNDTRDDAERVAKMLRGLRCKLNLIPFNPWPGSKYARPTPEAVDRFGQILLDYGYTVTVRYSKGDDIGAACGQLDGTAVHAD